MATLRPPVPAVGGWEQGGPPPSPKPARAQRDGDHHQTTKPKPKSSSSSRPHPPPKIPKDAPSSSVDDAAAELMSYLETTSSALSASARTAEREASEARENARAALQIAQNYSLGNKPSSPDGAVLPSSPGGKKRKNPLLAAASTTTPTVSGVIPPPIVPPMVGVGVGVGAAPAGTGTAGSLATRRGHQPPPPRPPSSAVGTATRGRPTSSQVTVESSPSSTSRLAQSHAEDVLSLALEVETLRSQLENERQSHDRTRSLLASEKTRSEELEEDLRTTTKELESTVERNRRESERRSRELEVAVAKSVAAEEDAALALDLAKAANEGRERMEGWLNAAMEEIERLKAGGGGGNAEDGGGAQDTTTEEALLAADRVRHEIEVEEEGERGAHPHNPGELLKRDSSIFHHTHAPSNEKGGNDVGGRAPETTIFDPSAAAAAAGSSASARAGGGGAAIPEHASFDPLADDGEEEEDMSSSYGVGYDDAPTDVSLAGDMTDDADASLTTVGTNPSLGTPGGGGAGLAYVFATDDDGGDGVDDDVEKEEEEGDDIGGEDAPAPAPAPAPAAVTTPPAGNNNIRGGAPRAMVAVGRDLLLRRTAATASGNAAGDPASRSPSSMAYRVSLAKIAERRTRLHERLNRASAAADVELEGGGGSPAAAVTSSPGEHLSQRRGVDLGRHRIYLTSASADKVLELLRDSGRRLRLGRNFVLTDTVGDVGGGFFGSGEDDIGGRSPSGGGTGAGAVDAEEDEKMETGRSTLSNIEGIAANYCRAVEAKVNLQREECRQLESLCEYLERKVVESDFGQDLA